MFRYGFPAQTNADKSEYQQKADDREKADDEAEESALDARKRKRLARDPLHNGLIVQRTELQGRQYQIDLASRLGKTQVGLLLTLQKKVFRQS